MSDPRIKKAFFVGKAIGKKQVKQEPVSVKVLSLSDFEELTRQINKFRDGADCSFDDDSLEITFYDNGQIFLSGTYCVSDSKEVMI
jgi:hypothetical protein